MSGWEEVDEIVDFDEQPNEKVDDRDQQIKRLESSILQLEKEKETSIKALQLLQEKLGTAATHLRNFTEENSRLKQESQANINQKAVVEQLENALKNSMSTTEELTKELNLLKQEKSDVSALQQNMNDLLQKIEFLQRENEAEREKLAFVTKERENIALDFEKLTLENSELKDKAQTETKQDDSSLHEEINLLKKENNDYLEKINQLDSELNQSRLKMEQFDESENTRVQNQEIITSLEQEKAQLLEKLETINQNVAPADENTKQVDELKKKNIELAEKVNQLEQVIEKMKNDSQQESLIKQQELTGKIAELEQENVNINEFLEKSKMENAKLLEKMAQVKTTLAPRLQQEISENARLNKLVEDLNTEIEQLKEQSASNDFKDQYNKSQRDVARLRQHLLEAEEIATQEALKQESVLKEFRIQMESIKNEKLQWETVADQQKDQIQLLSDEKEDLLVLIDRLKEENHSCKTELESQSRALKNLQVTLHEFESEHQIKVNQVVEKLKSELSSATKLAEEFKKRAETAENELCKIDIAPEELDQLHEELAQRNVLIGKLRHDLIQSQAHLSEAMKRIGTEDAVDRRLIANLIVQYITAPQGEQTRVEMLKVISGILKFTPQEQAKCGLIRRMSGWKDSPEPNENFVDMWISFLMQETNAAKSPNSQPMSPVESTMATQEQPKPNPGFFGLFQ